MFPTTSIILAVGPNGLIGVDNKLPWSCPTDMAFFKATTMGRPVVYGRKTYESMGRALPGRTNIVLSRSEVSPCLDAHMASDLNNAIHRAQQAAISLGVDELFIMGGKNVYEQAWDKASHVYITRIQTDEIIAIPEGEPVHLDPALLQQLDSPLWELEGTHELQPGVTVSRYVRVLDPSVDYRSKPWVPKLG